jgi:lysozyme
LLRQTVTLIHALKPSRARVLGLGTLSVGLVMTLGTSIQAERAATRVDQAQVVAEALRSQDRSERSKDLKATPYTITPERRALLNTIRYAEGTWKDGEDKGYRIMYGGGQFQDLSRHPERVVVKRYASAAAGAYQFLPKTWKGVAQELMLNSFEPKHQDQAALHLAERRGALDEIDRQGLTKEAMAKLAPEWASFPTKAGRSAYGQPVKSHQELASFYSSNLRELRDQLGA